MTTKQCSVCDRQSVALGFCHKHYERYRKYGDPNFTKFSDDWGERKEHELYATWAGQKGKRNPIWDDFQKFVLDVEPKPVGHTMQRPDKDLPFGPDNFEWFKAAETCSECGGPTKARGLCQKHYARLKRHGSPKAVKKPAHWTGKSKHKLYHRWKGTKIDKCGRDPYWDTFENFLKDVGDKDTNKYMLRRKSLKEQWGPNNFYWHEIGVSPPNEHKRTSGKQYRLKFCYGMTLEEYDKIYMEQGGVCAICENPQEDAGLARNMAVDHDHETRTIRGLLCSSCNRGIGLLKDSPELLRKAAEYLEKYKVL